MLRLCCAATIAFLPVVSAPVWAADTPQARVAFYRDRVARLEDQDRIENLQAMYGYYFDKGLWDQVATLFTRDGSFEYGQRGVYVGPDRIRRALLLFGPQGLAAGYLNNHMQLQAIIAVAPSGQTATARWQGMVQLAKPGANGLWGVGVYENEYVKDGDVWKISKLHFYVTGLTDYDKGWAKSQLPVEGASALFPPDKGPTEVYRALPGAYVPPFSFKHPVTGKTLKDIPEPADDVVGRK
jgi:hypothetical protein